MERTVVNSSSVAALGHDPQTNRLSVEFRSGHVYEYADVPPSLYHELMAAPSIGRAVQQRIVGAGFRHTKIDRAPDGVA